LSNDLTKYQCGKSHAKKISQRALRRKDIKEYEASTKKRFLNSLHPKKLCGFAYFA
jgi:hypothetical protein